MSRDEIILVVVLVLVLLFTRQLLYVSKNTARRPASARFGLGLWVAQGFGLGLFPVGPGTLGSVLGVGWFACLITTGRFWVFVAGAIVGLALSVWLCGVAESALGRKDPASVVLDEISSVPVCFASWALLLFLREGSLPGLEAFFSRKSWLPTVAVFAAFRFFDVVKPWPVRQSQALPAGWGITIDDVLAALYVNLLVLLAYAFRLLPVG